MDCRKANQHFFFQCPANPAAWKDVARGFEVRWQLPHCIGALDGKHILIRRPWKSGSLYYNYKHQFSIVLLAIVDSDYKFLYVCVGMNGRVSDGGVYDRSSFSRCIEGRSHLFPDPDPLPGDERPCGYYLVADDAFALKEHLMKPFSYRDLDPSHRVFNYRLSRGRRVVENAFGIMANRWRVLLTPIAMAPSKVENIVLACCALHNWLRGEIGVGGSMVDVEEHDVGRVTPGSWRGDTVLSDAQLPHGTNITDRARQQRNYLVRYFQSQSGKVPWQDRMVDTV